MDDLIALAARKGLLDEAAARSRIGPREPTLQLLAEQDLLPESDGRALLEEHLSTHCGRCGRVLAMEGSRRACGPCEALRPVSPGVAEAARDPANVFGRYVRMRELGRGGMGAVFLAWDRELHREVALKIPRLDSPGDIARFRREALVAASLNHPNIAQVYEVGEAHGQAYLAMQRIDGEEAGKEEMGPARAAAVVRDAARAIQSAHERGVVHRDLKPGNLMIDRQGRVYVMDFGLAKEQQGGASVTQSGVMGTPAYMAPEQARGEPVDGRVDVYALGATLYALLTGLPPFVGEAATVMKRVLDEDPIAPRRMRREIPRDLECVVQTAMAKEKGRRYATAGALAEDLERFLRGEPIRARPPSWGYRARRRVARNPWAWGVAAAATVLIGAAGLIAGSQAAGAAKEREGALEEMRRTSGMALEYALSMRRAGNLAQMGRFLPELERACAGAVERAPRLAEPHYRLGRMYRALMRWTEALAEQERALAKEPAFGPSLYERAVLLSMRYRDRLEERRTELRRAGGARIAAAGRIATPGLGGWRFRVVGPADIGEGDEELRNLRDRIVADIEALRRSPEMSAAHAACAEGILRARQGAYPEAEEKLAAATRENPSFEEAYEALVEVELALEKFEEAVRWAEEGEKHDRGYLPLVTNGAFARHRWGYVRAARGEDPRELYEAAIAGYNRVLELDPTHAKALVGRGHVRMTWGLYTADRNEDPTRFFEAAVGDYDRALEMNPADVGALMKRADARVHWGIYKVSRGDDPRDLYRGAIEDCDRALALDPASAGALLRRAIPRVNWGYYEMSHGGDPTEMYRAAIEDYDRALRLDPGDAESLMGRGGARLNWGSYRFGLGEDPRELYGGAIADCERALAVDPARAEALLRQATVRTNLGIYLESRGEDPSEAYREAISDLERALEMDPRCAEALMRRGIARANWGRHRRSLGENPAERYAAAIEDYDRALALSPAYAEALMNRALARFIWGIDKSTRGEDSADLFGTAILDFDRVLELAPADGDAHGRRGLCRYMLYDWRGSCEDFEEAARRNPSSVPGFRTQWDDARERLERESPEY